MKIMKRIVLLGAVAAGFLMTNPVMGAEVTQNSVLDGMVVYIMEEQKPVKAGQVIVSVDSLVGEMPAARADSDGTIKKILVQKGMKVKAGDPVAVIET